MDWTCVGSTKLVLFVLQDRPFAHHPSAYYIGEISDSVLCNITFANIRLASLVTSSCMHAEIVKATARLVYFIVALLYIGPEGVPN